MARNSPPVPVHGTILRAEARDLHRALLEHYLDTGDIPTSEALAHAARVPEQVLPTHMKELATAGYLTFDESGSITCLFPFSATPTPYGLVINGRLRHAMCAIDALGVSAMLGRPLMIESICSVCGTPIRIETQPGRVTVVDPAATRIVAGSHEPHSLDRACCPLTSFVCSPAHAIERTDPNVRSLILSPTDAQRHAEGLFGALLTADSLPASLLSCP